MISSSLILPLIALGTIAFLAYLFFTFRTHGGTNDQADSEEQQDLHTIDKMKEFQLIKDTKKVQTLSEKNKLFQRAYANKYGQSLVIEDPLNNTQQYGADEHDLPDNYAARTSFSAQKDGVEEDPHLGFDDLDQDIQLENLELLKANELLKDFSPTSFDDIKPSEEYIQQQEKKRQQNILLSNKNLEDDYTESEKVKIAILHEIVLHGSVPLT